MRSSRALLDVFELPWWITHPIETLGIWSCLEICRLRRAADPVGSSSLKSLWPMNPSRNCSQKQVCGTPTRTARFDFQIQLQHFSTTLNVSVSVLGTWKVTHKGCSATRDTYIVVHWWTEWLESLCRHSCFATLNLNWMKHCQTMFRCRLWSLWNVSWDMTRMARSCSQMWRSGWATGRRMARCWWTDLSE